VQATRRFFDIGGLDLGALVALELFTTVLPILLILFAWFEHFHPDENIGDLFLDQLGVHGSLAATVRSEFGNAAGLHPIWTFVGVTSYLVWGIPMSLTVARVFADAWGRPMYSILQRIWRGSVWFALYVVTLLINHRLAVYDGPLVARLLFVPLAAVTAELAFTVHSVFIGLAVGLGSDAGLAALLVALCFHQFFEGVALGARHSEAPLSAAADAAFTIVFAASAPLGIVGGIVLAAGSGLVLTSTTFLLVQGTFDAVCAGILLSIGFCMLAIDFPKSLEAAGKGAGGARARLALFTALWLGGGLMAFLGVYL
jgi:hypothetical protein